MKIWIEIGDNRVSLPRTQTRCDGAYRPGDYLCRQAQCTAGL